MSLLGYIIVGILTGIFSGLLGLGGGIIIVPALVFLFTWQDFPKEYLMQLATGTSLGAMILTTMMATWSHHKRGSVRWELLKYFLPGIAIGAVAGVVIAKHISTTGLQIAFALFAILLGIRLIVGANKIDKVVKTQPHALYLFMIALMIGTLAGMLGIGGGVILVPVFIWLGLTMTQASATSAACAFASAVCGAIMAVIAGWHIPALPSLTWGFVHWEVALVVGVASLAGAPIGVYFAHNLPVPVIKRIFGGILLLIAARMLPI